MNEYRPPWVSSSTSKRARQSETKGADRLKGRRVPGSGSGRQKGDIRTAQYRVEDKTTGKLSYSVSTHVLDKIEYEALSTPPGLLPMLRITLGNGKTYLVVREQDFPADQNFINPAVSEEE